MSRARVTERWARTDSGGARGGTDMQVDCEDPDEQVMHIALAPPQASPRVCTGKLIRGSFPGIDALKERVHR